MRLFFYAWNLFPRQQLNIQSFKPRKFLYQQAFHVRKQYPSQCVQENRLIINRLPPLYTFSYNKKAKRERGKSCFLRSRWIGIKQEQYDDFENTMCMFFFLYDIDISSCFCCS